MDPKHLRDKIWIRDTKKWSVGVIKPSDIVIIAPRENLLRQLFVDIWFTTDLTYEEYFSKVTEVYTQLVDEARKINTYVS